MSKEDHGTAGKYKLEFFPEVLNELRVELKHHHDLMLRLAEQSDKDVYVQIGEIAAYCNILYVGTFTREDMLEICEKCLRVLRSKRTILILPG